MRGGSRLRHSIFEVKQFICYWRLLVLSNSYNERIALATVFGQPKTRVFTKIILQPLSAVIQLHSKQIASFIHYKNSPFIFSCLEVYSKPLSMSADCGRKPSWWHHTQRPLHGHCDSSVPPWTCESAPGLLCPTPVPVEVDGKKAVESFDFYDLISFYVTEGTVWLKILLSSLAVFWFGWLLK